VSKPRSLCARATKLKRSSLCPSIHKRKNWLFAGADSGGRHWAMVATLIQTAKLNDVDPLAWLTDVLERIVSGRTKRNELPSLLPWVWKNASPAGVNTG
jgi:transposase